MQLHKAWLLCLLLAILRPAPLQAAPGEVEYMIDNPSPNAGDRFGASLASDGNIILVGAPFDSTIKPAAGTVYAFDASDGTLVATLNNPSATTFDSFGASIAISGNTIAVGAPGDNSGAGSVYLFNTSDGQFTRALGNPFPQVDSNFGFSVAVSSAGVLVGVPFHNTGRGDNTGTAYLFDPATGNQLQTLSNPDQDTNDQFGYSVAAQGNTLAIGAPEDRPEQSNQDAGQVFIFDAVSGLVTRTIANLAGSDGDLMGTSLDLQDDNVAIGAPFAPLGNIDSGNAFVYDLTTGNQLRRLVSPDSSFGGLLPQFGDAVAFLGTRLIVGSKGANIGNSFDSGRAYLYEISTGRLDTFFDPPVVSNNDLFGSAVAAAGKRVVISSPMEALGQDLIVGRVYVFGNPLLPREIIDHLLGLTGPQPEFDVNADQSIDVADVLRSYLPN